VESVYSAVRTDSLYKADYISSLKAKPCRNIVSAIYVDVVHLVGFDKWIYWSEMLRMGNFKII